MKKLLALVCIVFSLHAMENEEKQQLPQLLASFSPPSFIYDGSKWSTVSPISKRRMSGEYSNYHSSDMGSLDELYDAIKEDDLEKARGLIGGCVDINRPYARADNEKPKSILHHAIDGPFPKKNSIYGYPSVDIICLLLNSNAKLKLKSDQEGESTLRYAIKVIGDNMCVDDCTHSLGFCQRYNPVIAALIDAGADVNEEISFHHKNKYNLREESKLTDKYTVLMEAAYRGNFHAVQELINRGADMNKRDSEGRSAFLEAAWKGDFEILNLFLDHPEFNFDKKNDGEKALVYAAIRHPLYRKKLFCLLLNHGVDPAVLLEVPVEVGDGTALRDLLYAKKAINKQSRNEEINSSEEIRASMGDDFFRNIFN